ncbi:MAG: hypothetical protein IT282_10985 [Bacteroidetes bacterium]|nr:hypothetical protein [Bacteroidota bacterium]
MDVRAIHTPPLTIGTPAHPQRREVAIPPAETPVHEAKTAAPSRHPVLTAEEQRYFENLFPESQDDAAGSPVYTENGIRPQGKSGTLVDRRV